MSVIKKITGVVVVLVCAGIIFTMAFLFRDQDNDTSSIFALAEEQESPQLTCEHVFESATGDVCTKCGYVFVPEITSFTKVMYSVKDNCPVRSACYQGDNVVQYLSEDEEVNITGSLINALDHLWYITDDGWYIYGGNLTTK